MNRVVKVVALAGAAAVAGSVVTIAVRGRARVALPQPPPVSTARVSRTTLVNTVQAEGTLAYGTSPPVVNRVQGTYTALPAPGTTVGRGGVLYRVDNRPVALLYGTTPAWRPFATGMTDGPDVAELQANLQTLGFPTETTGHFGTATEYAVERWQYSLGDPPTGRIELGDIVFLPTDVRVGAWQVAIGGAAAPGAAPYAVTTTSRIVSVPDNPELPPIAVGERVTVTLSTNATVGARVTAIAPVPPSTGQSRDDNSSSSSSAGSNAPTALVIVRPDRPAATANATADVQVSLVTQSAPNVLAVPVGALLALANGGYGVETVEASGQHRLVGVTTGVFTGTSVAIAGRGIAAGTTVVVAQ